MPKRGTMRLCWKDMGVVAPRNPGICSHWGCQEVSHNPNILSGGLMSFHMHPTCACQPYPSLHYFVVDCLCVYWHMLLRFVWVPVLLHVVMEHACKHTLGLCGSPKMSCWTPHTAPWLSVASWWDSTLEFDIFSVVWSRDNMCFWHTSELRQHFCYM